MASLCSSLGRAFKSPTIRQLYYDSPFYHSPFWVQSNPDLEPETSIGYSLGVDQYLFNEQLIVNLGVFRNDIEDMVQSETYGTYNGEELRIYKNVEEAQTQGFEVTARVLFDNDLTLTTTYVYTDSENKESGNELTYTPHHHISITPSYEYEPWGIGASAVFAYNSDQYSDTANLYVVDDHTFVDANIYKRLGKDSKLIFQADNIFDSDRGDARNFRSGRTLLLKLDINI